MLVIVVAGCQSAPRRPSVAKAAAPVARAEVSAERSKVRLRSTQAKVGAAQEAVSELERTATPEQKPLIAKVRITLDETQRLLADEVVENELMTVSLRKAQDGLTAMLLDQERVVKELADAKARGAAYTRLKLWLAGLAAALAGWLAWRMVPVFAGPYRIWAVAGAGVLAAGVVWAVL